MTKDFWVEGISGKTEVFFRDPIPHAFDEGPTQLSWDSLGNVTVVKGGVKVLVPCNNVLLIRHTSPKS